MTLQITQQVDARGLNCPMPIVKTAQAMKAIPSGSLLEVLATDPGSVKDFEAWSRTTGNELVERSVDGGVYRFVLRRK
ncbi:MAG TPA: sulfurtransferase TusA family protein [Candidatus Limnocylindrales bacterium]|jgi:tRNA 2-thiouridine synthesizing protein A|nr:sulfurtransferase TusA family protein [Candidatus Limnocylindrales bacterium]